MVVSRLDYSENEGLERRYCKARLRILLSCISGLWDGTTKFAQTIYTYAMTC